MTLIELLKTNYDNKNIKNIIIECDKLKSKELDTPLGGIAPPLIISVYFSCPEAVKLLLKKGSNINQLGVEGSTPIYWAFVAKNIEIIELLMDQKKKIDFTIEDKKGKTPLFPLCSYLNSVKCLEDAIKSIGGKKFKKYCNKESRTGDTLLSSCIECITNYKDKKRNIDLVEAQREIFTKMDILIEHGADINKKLTISGKNFSLLDFVNNNKLIKEFPDIAENLVIYLLDKGLNGRNCGDDTSLLYTFSQYGNFGAVKLLVDNGYDINKKVLQNCTPLISALSSDHFEIARYLIERGADINAIMDNGTTPIYYSIKSNNNDFTKELLPLVDIRSVYKEPINSGNINLPANYNILHLCCEMKNYDLITVLIDMGMDISEKGRCSISPLKILERKRIPPQILDFITRPHANYKDYAKNKRDHKLHEEEDCAICMEQIINEITVLGCKHVFHSSCILELLSRGENNKCPFCRAPLELSYKVKLPEKIGSRELSSPSKSEIKRTKSLPPPRRSMSIPSFLPETSISEEKEDLFSIQRTQSKKRTRSLNRPRNNKSRSHKKSKSIRRTRRSSVGNRSN